MANSKEDVHFLIDNAPPEEVKNIIRLSSQENIISNEEYRKILLTELGFSAQKEIPYSTRRLLDLEILLKKKALNGIGFKLSNLGIKIRELLFNDIQIFWEVMHYLHYTGYKETPTCRKLFWSYQACSDLVWDHNTLLKVKDIVSYVQGKILEEYPESYSKKRKGGNFNAGGVSGWKSWIKQLDPTPIDPETGKYSKRDSERYEVVLLAMNYVYEKRGLRIGDPIILDDELVNEISKIFFLDETCCRNLLSLADKITGNLEFRNTFAGTSVNLLKPYKVFDI